MGRLVYLLCQRLTLFRNGINTIRGGSHHAVSNDERARSVVTAGVAIACGGRRAYLHAKPDSCRQGSQSRNRYDRRGRRDDPRSVAGKASAPRQPGFQMHERRAPVFGRGRTTSRKRKSGRRRSRIRSSFASRPAILRAQIMSASSAGTGPSAHGTPCCSDAALRNRSTSTSRIERDDTGVMLDADGSS